MGLGKTLQSICMIAGDHHSKATVYKVMWSRDKSVADFEFLCYVMYASVANNTVLNGAFSEYLFYY